MGTGKVALTSENGEIKRNVSFGKSKPELTFLFIISSKEADRKKEYKKSLCFVNIIYFYYCYYIFNIIFFISKIDRSNKGYKQFCS